MPRTNRVAANTRYDDNLGRLSTATDADGHTETYGYDPTTNNMNLVTDKRGNQMVQNFFDGNGRVVKQILADGAVWQSSYTLNANGTVAQTTVTDPRNYVREHIFNASGCPIQTVLAMGAPEQQTYTISLAATNMPSR